MKIYILLFFVSLLLSACQKTQTQTQAQTQSESIPIMGYDKVTWGTSIQDVRRTYGISDSVETVPAQNSDMIILVQENVSDSIKSRYFRFLDNKLCVVSVSYRIPSVTDKELLTALKVKFGESTEFNESAGIERTVFGKYSPELVVILIRMYNWRNMEEEELLVYYTGQRFIDEYEASKVEL